VQIERLSPYFYLHVSALARRRRCHDADARLIASEVGHVRVSAVGLRDLGPDLALDLVVDFDELADVAASLVLLRRLRPYPFQLRPADRLLRRGARSGRGFVRLLVLLDQRAQSVCRGSFGDSLHRPVHAHSSRQRRTWRVQERRELLALAFEMYIATPRLSERTL
jgi:hypothetical protein